MSHRVTHLIFILSISCTWLSWSEHIIEKHDPVCTAQPHRRPQQLADTEHNHRQDSIVALRGGDNNPVTITSSDTSTVESVIYECGDLGSYSDLKVEPESLRFSVIQPGDGSQGDPDGIPTRFLLMQKGHRDNAIKAFTATKAWREKYSIDTILSRPHPNYDVYKAIFPVFLAGRDPTGHIIIVEQLGKLNDGLAKRKNIPLDEVLFHFVFMIEYCWNILDQPPHSLPSNMMHSLNSSPGISDPLVRNPKSHGSMVTIMDCHGLTMSSLLGLGKVASENRKFLIKFVQTLSDNYPLRSYKTLIVNAPNWIHSIYFNLIRPLLRESSREKIRLFHGGKEQQDALRELGLWSEKYETDSPDNQEELTSANLQLIARQSSMEQGLRNFVLEILKSAGEAMNKVD